MCGASNDPTLHEMPQAHDQQSLLCQIADMVESVPKETLRDLPPALRKGLEGLPATIRVAVQDVKRREKEVGTPGRAARPRPEVYMDANPCSIHLTSSDGPEVTLVGATGDLFRDVFLDRVLVGRAWEAVSWGEVTGSLVGLRAPRAAECNATFSNPLARQAVKRLREAMVAGLGHAPDGNPWVVTIRGKGVQLNQSVSWCDDLGAEKRRSVRVAAVGQQEVGVAPDEETTGCLPAGPRPRKPRRR
jgi:hypothetical protein